MDLYILNPDLEIIKVIDSSSSVIWTRRYYEAGDFEVYIKADEEILNFLQPDHYIMRYDSDTTMVIDKPQLTTDEEEGDYLTVTGQDLKSLLKRRIIWASAYNVSGTVKECVNKILMDNVISPAEESREIKNFVIADYNIPDHIIQGQYTGADIYELIVELCKTYDLGWNIRINDSKQFEFYMYEGVNRSYEQDTNDYVVFSNDFENIVTTEYVYDKSALKNVALIGGEGEGSYRRMHSIGNQSDTARREMFVDASDITSDTGIDVTERFTVSSEYKYHDFTNYIYAVNEATIDGEKTDNYIFNKPPWDQRRVYFPDCVSEWSRNSETGLNEEHYVHYSVTMTYRKAYSPAEYNDLLAQRGMEEMAKLQAVEGLSGEVDSARQYILDQDFFLGDIVQIKNEYGIQAQPRIIEVIECEDENGISVTPTFTTWEVI